jgi:hypothetical protein
LKGGHFDISKGCHPQHVEKYTIAIENEPQSQTNVLFSGQGTNWGDSHITSEMFDRLTDDVLLL